MSIEAMRQALEALDCIHSPLYVREIEKIGEAMDALRDAIEQGEKPVAWTSLTEIDWARREPGRAGSFWVIPNDPTKEIALYTAPRKWVGLTDEEVMKTWNRVSKESVVHIKNFAHAIEAKLKEKNA